MARDALGQFESKLTPSLARSIVASVKSGLFDAQNALRHGVDVTTLKSWIERGVAEDAVEPYKSFAEAYVLASIELEERVIGDIVAAASGYVSETESVEVTRGRGAGLGDVDSSDVDSSDADPDAVLMTKTKRSKGARRGDWRAAAWYAERRWPLRWGISRQPEGGPKEAIKLPEATVVRALKVRELVKNPPPELVKAFRDAGYDVVRRAPE